MTPRIRTFCYGFALSLCIAACGNSEEPATKAIAKYRVLLKQLVSPNQPPATRVDGNGGHAKFPRDYDVAAQERINSARQALHQDFERALPYLIEGLSDDRYCMTINWADGDGYYNYSVGQICQNVIAAHLEIYRDKMEFTKQRWHEYNYEPISKEWFEKHKDRTEAELQVEAIDWALAKIKKANRSKAPTDEMIALQKLRDQIATSKIPIKARRPLPMIVSDE